jgi:L-aspartate semialdehyde sulfurtransferase ferredoxin
MRIEEERPVRTQRVRLTFPEPLIKEPVIHTLGRRFGVVTNIRRADIRETTGWVVMEITGTERGLGDARRYLEGIGVQVDDLEAYVE